MLQDVLSVDRHAQALVLRIRDYYFTERIYLLRCLKHLFSFFMEDRHPYYMTQLYEDLCMMRAPTWQTHGTIMNDRQASLWMLQNLREQELYALISTLLKKCFLAINFWEVGMKEGIGSLLDTALSVFPLESGPPLQLLTSLATADRRSGAESSVFDLALDYPFAEFVVQHVRQLCLFMEMDDMMQLLPTDDKTVVCLGHDRQPYGPVSPVDQVSDHMDHMSVPYEPGCLIIPKGTLGRLYPQREPGVFEIQWDFTYDGWTVFVGEIRILLFQVSQGAGMVRPALLHKVTSICGLLHGVLKSDSKGVEQCVGQLPELIRLVYQVIQRFSLLSVPSLDLVAICLRLLTEVAKTRPKEVWHGLQQTGLLPFATEPLTDIVRTARFSLLSVPSLDLVAICLRLLTEVAKTRPKESLHKAGCVNELMLCVLFISATTQGSGNGLNTGRYGCLLAGFECTTGRYPVTSALLDLLPVLIKDIPLDRGNGMALRDMCVHCLLFTESGRTLLDIISLGVDTVEQALASQHRHFSQAFSVLNRLLLLRPPSSAPSPVEHILSVQPANEASRHVAATIAQYIFHRHNPHLPTLTTLLLKRLAQVFPMSILACLGNEAESIRDAYLARLYSNTEVTMSCLQTVQSLISAKKQGTYHCPSELLCAALEFLHALWEGRQEVAMSVLKEKEDFWQNVCLSLTRDLKAFSDSEVNPQVLNKETDAVSYIMRIIAMEQFATMASNRVDKKLEDVMSDLLNKGRLDYWSQRAALSVKRECRQKLLDHLLEGIECQVWSTQAPVSLIYMFQSHMSTVGVEHHKLQSLMSTCFSLTCPLSGAPQAPVSHVYMFQSHMSTVGVEHHKLQSPYTCSVSHVTVGVDPQAPVSSHVRLNVPVGVERHKLQSLIHMSSHMSL
ncbi:hypothetical protein NP493_83g05030 [Ridgeia piscesae]|uniref:Nucleoporin Nup188 N-terminal subdomain III domain-containing protein n=1 Tax=Ridgeia piscesae TaxID=27915 RepID=A0AAD9UI52_RIDPI|nr:hypothetical protein NP493_83g05030 [Ridgeia piscesae]